MPAMSKILPNKSMRWETSTNLQVLNWEAVIVPPLETEEFQHRIACVHHFMICHGIFQQPLPQRKKIFQRINIPSAQTQLNFIIHRFQSHIKHKYIYIYTLCNKNTHLYLCLMCGPIPLFGMIWMIWLYWSCMLKGVIGEPPDDLPWLKKMAMAGLRQLCCGMPPGPMVSFRMDDAWGIDVCQSHS